MKAFISIPTTGWVHKHVAMTACRLSQDPRCGQLIFPTHRPFENNLSHIVNQWMDESDEDFWLSFDADNPPMRNPLELMELDLDIIGCPTPVWHYTGQPGERPIYWNAYDYVPKEDGYRPHEPMEGLQKVEAIGTGCFLVHRRVFENPEMRKSPFMRTWNEDGTVHKGNDIAFCERARNCGFEIWAHYDYPCRHFVELELTEVARAFKGLGVN